MKLANQIANLVIALLFASGTAWAAPAQVLLIRHAEKPDFGGDLSDQGRARAQALVAYFRTNPDVTHFGVPVAIYAMSQNSPDTGMRPIETVTPLANSLGMPIQERFGKYDIQPLASEILSTPQFAGRMVLVCWEHKMIAPIAQALGVSPAPRGWSSDVYDEVWELDYDQQGRAAGFREFKQQLQIPGLDFDLTNLSAFFRP